MQGDARGTIPGWTCAAICCGLSILVAAPAAAERVCVEELSGVCLKYKEVRSVSRAEQTECSLSLDRAERRVVQSGLKAADSIPAPSTGCSGRNRAGHSPAGSASAACSRQGI